MAQNNRFSSNLAAILTMIGLSVGLGNVWRFPYMMGQYGGSAFLFVYVIFTVIFAIPALMAELALGREKRSGPMGVFTSVFGKHWGKWVGLILLLTVLVADSYYLVVIGNVAYTTLFSIFSGFSESTQSAYSTGLNNGLLQYTIALLILTGSLAIVNLGINRGIEKVSKIFVPFFLVAIIYLIINALSLEGTGQKLQEFITPDISAINIEVIFAAMGQSFFSLGLGGTFLLLYGSYMKSDQNIATTAFSTSFGDMIAALLASLFIIPTILVFNMDMTSGPTLIFQTLPTLFSQMPGGRWLGSLFLLSLTMIAFLSNVAALEVFANALIGNEKLQFSRKKAVVVIGLIEVVLMFPSAMNARLIGYLDLIFGSGMQTLGSALCVVALAWVVGKQKVTEQIFKTDRSVGKIYFTWIKWVIPAVLILILLSYIYNSIT